MPTTQGANASEASLTASLDLAGIAHSTIKGGDNETDAGYQGLMRQAADGDPDLIVSLYADAGCVGTIRGRASLGIEIPVVATSICADQAVIDIVGDDALGWSFVGIQTDEDTPEKLMLQEMLSPALGVSPEEVDPAALGLGGLGAVMMMSLAEYGGAMVEAGTEVTGSSLYEYLGVTPELTLLARWIPGRMRPGDRLSGDLRLHVPVRRVPGGWRRADRAGPRSGVEHRLPPVSGGAGCSISGERVRAHRREPATKW